MKPSKLLLSLGLVLMILFMTSACAPYEQEYEKARIIPEYPNAENLVRKEESPFADINRTLEYETPDSPQAIFAYYEELLAKDKWVLNTNDSTETERHFRLHFDARSGFDYWITTSVQEGLTHVKILSTERIPR